jgi:hypothetical protein
MDDGWMDMDDEVILDSSQHNVAKALEQVSAENLTKLFIHYAREWDAPFSKAQ